MIPILCSPILTAQRQETNCDMNPCNARRNGEQTTNTGIHFLEGGTTSLIYCGKVVKTRNAM
jgi:hypothetical protein